MSHMAAKHALSKQIFHYSTGIKLKKEQNKMKNNYSSLFGSLAKIKAYFDLNLECTQFRIM